MPKIRGPKSPAEAYRMIIDQLVNETRLYGSAIQVKEKKIFSRAPDHRAFNEFIASLDRRQRKLLSQMLQEERDSAIHDVLADFSGWMICWDLGLTFRGRRMPADQSGMGLHGDFIGRRDGWKWPRQRRQHP